MKLLPWLLLTIAIAVIILISRCEGNQLQPVTSYQHAIDSIAAVNEITIAAKDDTIMQLKLALGQNEIELNKGLADKEDIEHKAGNQIAELTFQNNKYRTALAGKDTIGAVEACNEYMRKSKELYAAGQNYVSTINKLVKDGKERLRLDSIGIATRDNAIASIQSQYQTTAGYLKSATGLIGKLQQADKKRFVVGPFVGVGLSAAGKIVPVGGVGVTYRLFRF